MANLKIGVIADDFTGATDIASFLVLNGLKTVQLCGVTEDLTPPDAEAIVISHKSRSCPVKEALAEVGASFNWLKKHGCKQIYFKYCSTFDSTKDGNIGPVTDFLMEKLGTDFTVVSPALPVNGRTVYKGYLFVGDTLLEESGMRNHPVTPMTDSSLVRLMEAQSKGKCGVVEVNTIRKGVDAIKARIEELKQNGFSYAVMDAIDETDLVLQGEALKDMALVTGGSGLALGLARAVCEKGNSSEDAQKLGYPQGKKAVVLSGSCSVMTNQQVEFYKSIYASKLVDVDALLNPGTDFEQYLASFVDFAKEHLDDERAPIIYATANKDDLARIQKQYGAKESSEAVENFFAAFAKKLKKLGVERFIVAGGETSGIVTKSLEVDGFFIGPAIAPGVPWVRSINSTISLTLKSGNFGQEDFFLKAQKDFPV